EALGEGDGPPPQLGYLGAVAEVHGFGGRLLRPLGLPGPLPAPPAVGPSASGRCGRPQTPRRAHRPRRPPPRRGRGGGRSWPRRLLRGRSWRAPRPESRRAASAAAAWPVSAVARGWGSRPPGPGGTRPGNGRGPAGPAPATCDSSYLRSPPAGVGLVPEPC